jgi:acyl carrier protein
MTNNQGTSNKQAPKSNSQITKEVIELVAKIVKLPIDKVTLESNLFEELNVDSLIGVEIFAALDKKYGIDVPEAKLKDVRTVQDLINLVNNLI